MTQEPQQPPLEPQGEPAATQSESAAPVPQPQQPQWGQYGQPQPGQQRQQPQQPQYGQPQQPQWGQYGQPQQPQWGQYGQPQQPQQPPQQPQYGQPQWGHYGQPHPGRQPQYAQQPGQPMYPGMQPGFPGYAAPPKPGVIPLRPLGVGEILDGAFQAARRNGKAMFGSALIFQLAITALTLLAMFLAFGSLMNQLFELDSTFDPADTAAMNELGGGLLAFSLSTLVTMFLSIMAQMVLQGALVIPVLRAVLNRKTSFGDMWRLAKPRIGSLILLALLYAAAFLVIVGIYAGIIVGLVLLMAPDSEGAVVGVVFLSILISIPLIILGVWAGTKILVAPAAIVVEDIGPMPAIKRSWQLTRGNWWRAFGISLLAAIIAGFVGSIITTPVSFVIGMIAPLTLGPEATADQFTAQLMITQAIGGVIGAVVGAVTMAFQTGVMSLIYVDLRMRRDGFDITLLKESESGKDDGGIPGSGAVVGQVPGRMAPGAPYQGGYPGAAPQQGHRPGSNYPGQPDDFGR